MLCYAMLCYIIACHTKLYYTILYYTILYYFILLYYTTLHYAMPCYTTLYHTILCYAMLYYDITWHNVMWRDKTTAAYTNIYYVTGTYYKAWLTALSIQQVWRSSTNQRTPFCESRHLAFVESGILAHKTGCNNDNNIIY